MRMVVYASEAWSPIRCERLNLAKDVPVADLVPGVGGPVSRIAGGTLVILDADPLRRATTIAGFTDTPYQVITADSVAAIPRDLPIDAILWYGSLAAHPDLRTFHHAHSGVALILVHDVDAAPEAYGAAYLSITALSAPHDLRLAVSRALEQGALKCQIEELETANVELIRVCDDLRRETQRLQEQDRMKSRFLSLASHELKTPLTAVSGFVQITSRRFRRRLHRGMPPTLDDWQQEQQSDLESLEIINSQATRLAALIDNLLDASRMESGRAEFHFAAVDVQSILQDIAGSYRLTTTAHEISVETVAGSDTTVMGDHDHLTQLFTCILDNAIKFSPEGGPIHVRVVPEVEAVLVSVQDRGLGIARDELDSIFQLVYRSNDATARRVGGMGVGLYISKEIVARHHGRIWADSEPGRGSTFSILLPRTQPTELIEQDTAVE